MGLFVCYLELWLSAWAVLPAAMGWTPIVITSGSMAPTVHTGDVVVASPHDGRGLGPGTVVVFEDPAYPGLLTHRIVAVNGDGSYVTRGDGNEQSDSTPLPPDQIVGVGRLLVPLVGLPLAWREAEAWGKVALWGLVLAASLWMARYAYRRPARIAHA